MSNEKEFQLIKLRYALLSKNLFKFDIASDYIEYLNNVLTANDKKNILGFIKKLIHRQLHDLKNTCKTDGQKDYLRECEKKATIILQMIDSEKKWDKILTDIEDDFYSIYLDSLEKIIKLISSKINKKSKKTVFSKRIDEIGKVFKLSDNEVEILTFLYLVEADQDVDSFFDMRHLNMRDSVKGIGKFALFFNLSQKELRKIFSKDGKLFRYGIVEAINGVDRLRLSDSIVSFLSGYSAVNIFEQYLLKAENLEALLMEKLNVSKKDSEIIEILLKTANGQNIIFHGEPGTGKTEFAKSIGKKLGKDVYFVRQKDKEGEESLNYRKTGIVAAQSLLDQKSSIIVVDEAEAIIRTKANIWACDRRSDNKAWVNDLMENSKHKIIWITNSISEIDDSTKRRFSYSVEFKKLTQKQRENVWKVQIEKLKEKSLNDQDIINLARRHHVSAGSISLALKNINSIQSKISKDSKINFLNNILERNKKFIDESDDNLIEINNFYSPKFVNADTKSDELISVLNKFISINRSSVGSFNIKNMNILFHGAPGTGKTEFVKYLSEKVGRELLVKRLSDIRSKYYGEDLKNIASMFKEAMDSEKILFLDEADTFFMNRENVNEHYRSETNELLTQMENFRGILVCATNFTESLDPAVMRRFNFKVKFDFLNDEMKVEIFKSMFMGSFSLELSDFDLNAIKSIKYLTPGDFKVVFQKNILLENVTKEKLFADLVSESSYKKQSSKKIGLGH